MTVETRTKVARRYFTDLWNQGNDAELAGIMSSDAVGHVGGETIGVGPQRLLDRRAALLSIYSGPTFTVESDDLGERRQLGAPC